MKIYERTETEFFYQYDENGDVKERYPETMRYTYIIGSAAEIKAIYRSMYKAYIKGVSNITPTFYKFPKFNKCKYYGIIIEHQGREPYDTGINNDMFFQVIGERAIIESLLL